MQSIIDESAVSSECIRIENPTSGEIFVLDQRMPKRRRGGEETFVNHKLVIQYNMNNGTHDINYHLTNFT